MRLRFGIGLWILAFCILASSAKDLEPVTGWHTWMMVGWEFLKIGLLVYSGILLMTADEEIERLEYSNKTLERIIGEISNRPRPPEIS